MSSHKIMWLGALFAFTSAVLNGVYVAMNRYAFTEFDVDPLDFFFTFIAMYIVPSITYLAWQHKRTFAHFSKKHLLQIGLLTIIGTAANGLYMVGLEGTTAVNASILTPLVVVTTAIASWFLLGDTLKKKQMLWILVMIVAMYVAIAGLSRISLVSADMLIIASIGLYGVANAFSKRIMKELPSDILLNLRLALGTVAVLAVAYALRGPQIITTSASFWPFLTGIMSWVTIFCFFQGTHFIGPTKTVTINRLAPVITIPLAVIFLGEAFSPVQAIALAAVLLAVYKVTEIQRPNKVLSSQ